MAHVCFFVAAPPRVRSYDEYVHTHTLSRLKYNHTYMFIIKFVQVQVFRPSLRRMRRPYKSPLMSGPRVDPRCILPRVSFFLFYQTHSDN